MTDKPVFRFAPSPNGLLHLGHAYSALLNQHLARRAGGVMLLRIEDIDTVRCTPRLEAQMLDDLAWLGFEWDGEPRRQSAHFDVYADYLQRLTDEGLIYRSTLSRADCARIVESREAHGLMWPRDPDGAPLFPGRDYEPSDVPDDMLHALRLDMNLALAHCGAPLSWHEAGGGQKGETGLLDADPAQWGDVVLARKDTPTSYHLSVVVDDALQGVTHVVRGADLMAATSVHALLQALFGFSQPAYHHHGLIVNEAGDKLSKSRGDTAIASLRQAGMTPDDIRRLVGLGPDPTGPVVADPFW
ncbi:MAG: tRNA glutamyl-Q(34) synthetase GluQRS [Ahrensia sp.]